VNESRLGIPLIFGADVIHGFRTMFPMPLAEASSWEPALAERTARAAAVEATADGFRWTFAPMVDIARDARWGRGLEGVGEDVYLARQFAAARVRGFQGPDLSRPTPCWPRPSTSRPTARPRAGSTTTRATSPSARCARSTCRRFAPRWTRARCRS
jgi:beta-glucosidase-like glycosyl hydrolase